MTKQTKLSEKERERKREREREDQRESSTLDKRVDESNSEWTRGRESFHFSCGPILANSTYFSLWTNNLKRLIFCLPFFPSVKSLCIFCSFFAFCTGSQKYQTFPSKNFSFFHFNSIWWSELTALKKLFIDGAAVVCLRSHPCPTLKRKRQVLRPR